jgi:hypothetical protein
MNSFLIIEQFLVRIFFFYEFPKKRAIPVLLAGAKPLLLRIRRNHDPLGECLAVPDGNLLIERAFHNHINNSKKRTPIKSNGNTWK